MHRPSLAALFVLLSVIAPAQTPEQDLKKALAATPRNAQLHLQYGLFLSDQGRMKEAIDEFAASLKLNPRQPDVVFNLGLALLSEGRATEALQLLDNHPSATSDHLSLRGAALNALGRSPEAAQSLRRAVTLDPNNPDTLYDLAVTLLRIDAPAEAAQLLTKARTRFPKVSKIHAAAGMAAYAGGKNDEALRAYETAVRLEPNAADLYAALGDVYDAVGELQKAEAAYDKAVTLDRSSADYFLKYGRNQAKLQKPDLAATLLRQAIILEPANPEAHFELGKLAAAQSDDKTAASHFEQAVKANPNMKQGWYQLALSYRRTGQQEKSNSAMEQFRKLP
ncbi:MAG: tetratricopeptide repeat protein [Acidobacteria bacterium]|nr:tetratricopeptide repeat protein [Acidobacteriota bacterium]